MKKSKTAYALMEVVIGSVLLATVFAGVLAALVSSRRLIERANVRLNAALIARTYLSQAHLDVRSDTWDTAGNMLMSGGPRGLPGGAGDYSVADVNGVRELVISIDYVSP